MRDVKTVSLEELAQNARDSLAKGENITVIMTGWSMAPTLYPHRDKVVICPVDQDKLKAGDIVMFLRDDLRPVIHRIINIKGDILTMNGDAQSWTEKIPVQAVLGRAEYIYRKGKTISCDGTGFRLHYRLWGLTRPVRKALVELRRKIRSARNG